MLIVNTTRQHIITCLPHHNNVCEIGVDVGNYSSDILSNCNPTKLHLVDPWSHIDDPSYKNDTVNVDDDRQEYKFRSVLKRFSNEIISGQVKIHRGFSYDVLPTFPNNYFDWIYVDGMHTYEAVLNDFNLCYDKIKDDGFIVGHDYANHEVAQYMNFGVVDAISDFTRMKKCKLFAITLESGWPSYIIYKNNGPHVDHVIYNFITKTSNPIDISDDLWKDINFFQKWFMIDGNKYVTCLYKR